MFDRALICAVLTLVLGAGSVGAQASSTKKPAAKSTKPAAPVKAPVKTPVKAPVTVPKKLVVAPEPKQASPTESWVSASGNVILRDAPDGRSIASLGTGVPLTIMARDKAWVRVKIDGWVREDSVQLADLSGLPISAAQLHADPASAKGKTVRWDVQVLALETADPLHKDLNPDEPYLLVRGPGPESGLLYVAVPTGMLAQARALAALAPANAHLIATVRVGRSEPVGVPVLDAQSLVRR